MQTTWILKSGRTGLESMLHHWAIPITFMNLYLKRNIMANYNNVKMMISNCEHIPCAEMC